ncbi:TIGR03086 family metal-binding protein [Haloechinothrix sp. LS1_15]|uniref:TIGR03086 family metal-binding protein n=1 Tax=Haloechinothrix sp. LS1_15 TaxID=2652248 RepID=UPI0029441038|nr:TIGR03086 family metal-binding protein [Haloechinothrix sp. LS1_15]MDV6013303.1 TIGR03086 family protein [Haloechinothrix sp. LS1_15]
MPPTIDLTPPADRMAELVGAIRDDQLGDPTPCEQYTLGDLVDHIGSLSVAFAAAATKDLGPLTAQPPDPDAAHLGPDWRTRVPRELAALAAAWRIPAAWEGMTQVGGIDLPGEAAGAVALNELVVHGWDIARASGQAYDCDPEMLRATLPFVTEMAATRDEAATDGLFGPAMPVPDSAPLLDRVIGLTGRDPAWQARSRH